MTSEMHFVLCVHDQLHLRQRTLMGHSLRQQGQTKTDKGKKRNATEICLFTVIEVFFYQALFHSAEIDHSFKMASPSIGLWVSL